MSKKRKESEGPVKKALIVERDGEILYCGFNLHHVHASHLCDMVKEVYDRLSSEWEGNLKTPTRKRYLGDLETKMETLDKIIENHKVMV